MCNLQNNRFSKCHCKCQVNGGFVAVSYTDRDYGKQ